MDDRMLVKFMEEFLLHMGAIEGRNIKIYDQNLILLAGTEEIKQGQRLTQLNESDFAQNETFVQKGVTYQRVACDLKKIFYVAVKGSDEKALFVCNAVGAFVKTVVVHEGEEVFKINFLKRLITGNSGVPEDMDSGEWEFRHNPNGELRVAILEGVAVGSEKIGKLIKSGAENYGGELTCFPLHDDCVCLVFCRENAPVKNKIEAILEKLCGQIKSAGLTACAGIGSACTAFSDIPASYKDARFALECKKIFKLQQTVIDSDALKLEKALRYLPEKFCNEFIEAIHLHKIDEDTLDKINQFFKCNCNVLETSRVLFIHRNTLIYKLDKIKSETGLNIKDFDQAVIVKLASMMKQYWEYKKGSAG